MLESVRFSYAEKASGILEVKTGQILFAPGEYLVNIVVMGERGYERDASKIYFTVNENLLDHHGRAYKIIVDTTDKALLNDVVFVHESE